MQDRENSNDRHKKGINLMIDRDLWRRVKSQAALEEKSALRWVEEALRDKLEMKPVV